MSHFVEMIGLAKSVRFETHDGGLELIGSI